MEIRRGHASPTRKWLGALVQFALAVTFVAACALISGTIAAHAAAPPVITVSIGGKLLPGGQATATVKVVSGAKGTFIYVWQVNGAIVRTTTATTATNDNLPLTGLSYGAAVSVAVTPLAPPSAGAAPVAGTAASAALTLDDRAPTASLTLPAGPARPTGQLQAKVTTADADGDHVSVSYTWTVDGVVQRTVPGTTSTSDTFSWSSLSAGQVIAVSAVPNDGTMDGSAATASATVAETAPTATVTIGGQLNPQSNAVATVKTADAEKDPVTWTYVWKVNGDVVRTVNGTNSTSDQLPLKAYRYGNVVSVEVTPKDTWLTGALASDSDTMIDRAPVAKVQSLRQIQSYPGGPTPPGNAPWRPLGAATVNISGSDADRDPAVTYTYVWSINGVAQQTDPGLTATSDSFKWSGLPGGSVITVSVTPNDGTMDGAAVTSSQTIAETPPVATAAIGGAVRPGGLATVKVTVSDADGDPVILTYVWSVNGAVEQVDTNRTGTDDHFGVPASLRPGTPVIVRVTPSDGFFNGAVSQNGATVGTVSNSTGAAYDPATDPYSIFDTTLFTGAQAWWDAGYTGKGVDVAVIDTGVSPVPALSGSGKISYGPDLSLDSQNPGLANLDSNGHGTFMAGLIAGHDPALGAPYSSQPASVYRGMAPDAGILSIKVGATDGEVDVTQVIAAIDWIVQHRHDRGLNIRVISLAYGTNSTQDYRLDPLAYAAEQAWKAGVVVVAAAGNTGFQQGAGAPGVADPAMDPFVIAAGGVDSMGTYSNGDDRLGDYSATAGCPPPACQGPDILAYGSHDQGLRDPGSFIDLNHPEGRLDDLYFRGSGTSEATAITAGAIALILQRYPGMTPDDVKAFIQGGADQLPGFDSSVQGAGELDLFNLLSAQPPSGSRQSFPASTGLGAIEGSRGTDHLVANGVPLQGEEDIFGLPVNASALAVAEAAGNTWSGGTWNGNTWSGNSWSGNTWSGNTWSGNTWSGNTWSGNTWSGNTWSGNTWSGNSWSGNSWSGNGWSGGSWG